MRQLHLLRITVGLFVGLFGQVFYQIFIGQSSDSILSLKYNKCLPCEDPSKIHGEMCPFCGPEQVIMAKDPNILNAYKPKGMYEVTRWYYFNEQYLYDIINGEPKVKLLGSWYEETRAVTQVALEYVNANKMLGKTWSLVSLQNGYLRTDVFRGTDYILDLDVQSVENHPSESLRSTFRVRLVHAFEAGKDLKITSFRKEGDVCVHIIAPVSGDKETLAAFIQNFATISEKESHETKLTLVLFRGSGKFGEKSGALKSDVEEQIKRFPKIDIDFIELDGDYDYLRGIRQASAHVPKNDIILTLKIDMHFASDVIQTCRLLAIPSKRVYFPIGFSQYDPDIIERGMPPGKPKNINKMDINKFTGYWLHKVHDYICAYSEDLTSTVNRVSLTVGTVFQTTDAIGSEGGAKVYDAFLSDNMDIISSVEPGLIRLFHPRKCSKLSDASNEYQECFQTAAETLGSKPALSILYLTEIALKKV